VAGYVIGATGIACAVVWAATGIVYLEDQSTVEDLCSDGFCSEQRGVDAGNRGKRLGVVNTVMAAAAVGLTGVGLILVLTAPDDKTPSAALVVRPAGLDLTLPF
jgi:hypothetical protein